MARIVFMLLGGLVSLVGPMVGRVLLAMGMSFVTFKGFDLVVSWLFDQVKTNLSGMPSEVVSFMAWLWVDKALSMIFAAYTTALAIKMAGSSITKLVTKGKA